MAHVPVIYDPNWRDEITPAMALATVVTTILVLALGRLIVARVDFRWWRIGREIQRNRARWHANHPEWH